VSNAFLRSLGIGLPAPAPPVPLDLLSLRGAPTPTPGDSEAGAPWAAGVPIASSPASDLMRLWPPAVGSQPGQSLGWLQAAPRTPEAAVEVVCPATAYTLTLDPEWTAPNARIALSFGSGASRRRSLDAVLRPGQTIERPAGFGRFWIYNADGLELVTSVVANRNFGYCAFLVGMKPGTRPFYPSQPHPAAPAAAIHYGVPGIFSTSPALNPAGLGALRILASGLNAGNLEVAGQWYTELLLCAFDRLGSPGGILAPSMLETPDLPVPVAELVTMARVGLGPALASGLGGTAQWSDLVTVPVPRGCFSLVFCSNGVIVPAGSTIAKVGIVVEGIPLSGDLPPPSRREIIIYDVTSGAGLALDTGTLPTGDFDALYVDALASAGTMQLSPFEVSDAGVNRAVATPPAAAIAQQGAWGLGTAVPTGFAATAWAVPYPVPPRVRFTTSAAAAGTTRLRVLGVRSGFGR
jgi:hypothetical protein